MTSYYLWFAVAVVLVIAELATGTFYLLMIALGVAAGGVAALLGADEPMQTVAAALVAIVGIVLLRRTRFGKLRRRDADPIRTSISISVRTSKCPPGTIPVARACPTAARTGTWSWHRAPSRNRAAIALSKCVEPR
jgi:hypothetical protein